MFCALSPPSAGLVSLNCTISVLVAVGLREVPLQHVDHLAVVLGEMLQDHGSGLLVHNFVLLDDCVERLLHFCPVPRELPPAFGASPLLLLDYVLDCACVAVGVLRGRGLTLQGRAVVGLAA